MRDFYIFQSGNPDKASAHILMVSFKGTFLKRLLISKEHMKDVSFCVFSIRLVYFREAIHLWAV